MLGHLAEPLCTLERLDLSVMLEDSRAGVPWRKKYMQALCKGCDILEWAVTCSAPLLLWGSVRHSLTQTPEVGAAHGLNWCLDVASVQKGSSGQQRRHYQCHTVPNMAIHRYSPLKEVKILLYSETLLCFLLLLVNPCAERGSVCVDSGTVARRLAQSPHSQRSCSPPPRLFFHRSKTSMTGVNVSACVWLFVPVCQLCDEAGGGGLSILTKDSWDRLQAPTTPYNSR